jgi:amidase
MIAPASGLCALGAVEQARLVRAREVSARELVTAHLERIEAVNPQVNAIVTLADADRADAAEPSGPLHGLPVAIKDLVDVAGMRTTYGSPLHADHVPETDGLIVTRLRAAGAIVLGKTNTPEFGAGSHTFNPVFGVTRNPHDLSRSAGGSSGGSGAAVAAGMVALADGSDLGGSIRNPASFCGVFGLRPTPGRVPGGDDLPWDPRAVLGPIARSPEDAALFMRAVDGPDPRVPLSYAPPRTDWSAPLAGDVAGLRNAWSERLSDLPVEPAVTVALASQREALEALGCIVEPVEPELPGADEAFEALRAIEYAEAFGELLGTGGLKATIEGNARVGLELTGAEVARAITLQAECFHAMRELLERYDALALPAAQVVPFAVETEYPTEVAGRPMHSYIEWMRACSRITITAHPAVSVPGATTSEGLPVGLQIVGRWGADHALCGLAAALTRRPVA